VYNFTPATYNKWIRLRTNGEKATLCIKEIWDENKIDGVKELEIEVDNFEKTNQILETL
jgi:adenylate cyclase class IV